MKHESGKKSLTKGKVRKKASKGEKKKKKKKNRRKGSQDFWIQIGDGGGLGGKGTQKARCDRKGGERLMPLGKEQSEGDGTITHLRGTRIGGCGDWETSGLKVRNIRMPTVVTVKRRGRTTVLTQSENSDNKKKKRKKTKKS